MNISVNLCLMRWLGYDLFLLWKRCYPLRKIEFRVGVVVLPLSPWTAKIISFLESFLKVVVLCFNWFIHFGYNKHWSSNYITDYMFVNSLVERDVLGTFASFVFWWEQEGLAPTVILLKELWKKNLQTYRANRILLLLFLLSWLGLTKTHKKD
jgi:hypothetical protein